MSGQKKFYLKESVYFEPLFNHWYCWAHLLPPVTSARHMTHTHKRIMSSFVNNYQFHIMAQGASELVGGEFLHCTEDQVDNIKELIEQINTQHHDVVELSNAIKELDDLLLSHTSGETIEVLYPKVPKALQGYIELTMDMYHNPGYRFIESLLYRSSYYKNNLQSVCFGSLDKVDERPFVLSTPRLPDNNHLLFDANFTHPALDKLFSARTNPLSIIDIEQIFSQFELKGGLNYQELFSEEPAKKLHTKVENGVRVQYLGHAGFVIETNELCILVDPVIASKRADQDDLLISFAELPPHIDYICITHTHQDHANIETLLQLRHKTGTILVPRNNGGTLCDPSLKLMLQNLHFDVREMEDMEALPLKQGSIVAVPFLGEHGDLHIRSKTAWYIKLEGNALFFGADSANVEPAMYCHIQRELGDMDLLAIGMECIGAPYTWIYGALYTQRISKQVKDSRRLNGADFKQAAHLIDTFSPKHVYIYALGIEPWYKYFMGLEYDDDSTQIVESNKMIDFCARKDIPAKRLYAKQTLIFDPK